MLLDPPECCAGGELGDRIVNGAGVADGALSWQWAMELMAGVAHLHSVGIVHRDLKPANVLLTAAAAAAAVTGGSSRADADADAGAARARETCRIADFGLACQLDVSSGAAHALEAHLMSTAVGTPAYVKEPRSCARRLRVVAELNPRDTAYSILEM